MTNLIPSSTFRSAFQKDDVSQHGIIIQDSNLGSRVKTDIDPIDVKICSLSHQLFSLNKLIETNPDEIKFYRDVAKQIFVEKYGSLEKRGIFERFVSAMRNLFMGRGFVSSDHLVEKILKSFSLKVAEKDKLYFAQASKSFVKEIMESSLYSDEEKQELVNCSTGIYADGKNAIHKKSWVPAHITIMYLRWVSVENPDFRIIPLLDSSYYGTEFEDENLLSVLDEINSSLPVDISIGPSLFAHPIQVSGNHRTSLIIDLKNGTVEYYNSFGSDSSVKFALIKLKDLLSEKYNKPFVYKHLTNNIRLQSDTYECGIWACKFVEERIKQGIDFDPRSLGKDISKYRKRIYDKSYELEFFKEIGYERLLQFENKSFSDFESKKFAYLNQFNIAVNHTGCDRYYYDWCKNGKIPTELLNLISKTIEKTTNSSFEYPYDKLNS